MFQAHILEPGRDTAGLRCRGHLVTLRNQHYTGAVTRSGDRRVSAVAAGCAHPPRWLPGVRRPQPHRGQVERPGGGAPARRSHAFQRAAALRRRDLAADADAHRVRPPGAGRHLGAGTLLLVVSGMWSRSSEPETLPEVLRGVIGLVSFVSGLAVEQKARRRQKASALH